MRQYLQNHKEAVTVMHGSNCSHSGTSRVLEFWKEQKISDGDTETFTISGHPEAIEAFAWALHNDTEPESVAVLSIPRTMIHPRQ